MIFDILGSFDLSFDFSFEVGYSNSLCIVIVDKYGNPVSGASVAVIVNTLLIDEGVTDDNGKVLLSGRVRKYNQIVIKIAGYATTTITIPPNFNSDCKDYTISYCIESEEINRNSGNFFRFDSVEYCQLLIQDCTNFCQDDNCTNNDESYKLPALKGDDFVFIVNPEDIGLADDYELEDTLKLGIYQGGTFVQYEGNIEQPGFPDSYQLVCSVTIPNITFGTYQFGFSIDGADLIFDVSYVNTTEGNVDGEIHITPNTGYKFSIDGGKTFQLSGDYTGLPKGQYEIVVLDENCGEFNDTVTLIDNIDCALYQDSYVYDLGDIFVAETLNCYVNDFE